MIQCLYIISHNGDELFSKAYIKEMCHLPSHIANVAVMIFQPGISNQSIYYLNENGTLWTYSVYSRFILIIKSSKETDPIELKLKTLEIGEYMTQIMKKLPDNWEGKLNDFKDIEDEINKIVHKKISMAPSLVVSLKNIAEVYEETKKEIDYISFYDMYGNRITSQLPAYLENTIIEHINNSKNAIENDNITEYVVDKQPLIICKINKIYMTVVPAPGAHHEKILDIIKDISEQVEGLLT